MKWCSQSCFAAWARVRQAVTQEWQRPTPSCSCINNGGVCLLETARNYTGFFPFLSSCWWHEKTWTPLPFCPLLLIPNNVLPVLIRSAAPEHGSTGPITAPDWCRSELWTKVGERRLRLSLRLAVAGNWGLGGMAAPWEQWAWLSTRMWWCIPRGRSICRRATLMGLAGLLQIMNLIFSFAYTIEQHGVLNEYNQGPE